jgi:hypothetical protein
LLSDVENRAEMTTQFFADRGAGSLKYCSLLVNQNFLEIFKNNTFYLIYQESENNRSAGSFLSFHHQDKIDDRANTNLSKEARSTWFIGSHQAHQYSSYRSS